MVITFYGVREPAPARARHGQIWLRGYSLVSQVGRLTAEGMQIKIKKPVLGGDTLFEIS